MLRPAEGSLGPSERVLILPDGPLYELPFPALMRDNHYLAEWKPISTTLSATLFAQLKQQRRQPDSYRFSLAAFGDAVYTSSQRVNRSEPSFRSLQRSAVGGELTPLRFSKPEAEQIARLFPGRSQLYEGQSATEENAKNSGLTFASFTLLFMGCWTRSILSTQRWPLRRQTAPVLVATMDTCKPGNSTKTLTGMRIWWCCRLARAHWEESSRARA